MRKLLPLLGCALLTSFVGTAQSLPSSQAQASRAKPLVNVNDFAQYEVQTRQAMVASPKSHRISSQFVSSGARPTDPCNLLPNPSFEDQNTTPSGRRFNVFTPASNTSDELSGWMSTNGSTPDYFATNAPSPSDTNPLNQPQTGLGLFTPHDYDPNLRNGTVGLFINPSVSQQEYITPRAGAIPLKQGAYYAAFYAYYNSDISINTTKLGLDLIPSTNDPRTSTVSATYPRTSNSIESSGFISSASWTPVSGVLTNVAAGSYYVNIGNTSPSSQSSTGLAYYYIDDVQLYKIPTAGNDVSYVCGNSVTIGEGCPIPDAKYAWTTSTNSTPFATALQTSVTPTPGSQPQYILTVTLPDLNHTTYSTTVTATPSPPTAGPNLSACGTAVTIGNGCGATPGATYAWTTTDDNTVFATTMQVQVNPVSTTTYILTVTLPNGSQFVTSTTVSVDPPIAGPDHNICPGGSATLGAGCDIPGLVYRWSASSGSTTILIPIKKLHITVSPSTTTTYVLNVVYPNGMISKSSTTVTVIDPNNSYIDTNLDLQGAQKVCPFTTLIINVIGKNIAPPYYWTQTDYDYNGQPRGTFTYPPTQSPSLTVSVGDNPTDFTVTAANICTGQLLPVAPRTITPWHDPNGGFYCDPTTPFRTASSNVTPVNQVTSTGQTETGSVAAYPNPATETLTITLDTKQATVTLYDAYGQPKAVVPRVEGNQTTLDTRGLPAGLYHLQVTRPGKARFDKQIEVRH